MNKDKKKDEGQVEGSEQEFATVFNEVAVEGGDKAKEPAPAQPGSEADKKPTEEEQAKATETEEGKDKEADTKPTDADSQGKEKEKSADDADVQIKAIEDKKKRGEKLTDDETKALYKWLDELPFEERVHKHKTLEGMYNSETKKRRELEAEIKKLKEAPPAAPDKDATDKGIGADKDKKPAADVMSGFMEVPEIKAFSEEYDEIAPGVLKIAEHTILTTQAMFKNFSEKLAEALSPVLTTHEKTDREKHFAAIKQEHPDFDAYNANADEQPSELEAWVETLPAYKKEAYKQVLEAGTAEEVIDMVRDFRTAKGYTGNGKPKGEPSPVDEIDEEKIKGMEAVRTKKGPLATTGKGGVQDYEGAFAEAATK